MKKKEIYKYANQINEAERIISNKNTSKEEKNKAYKKMNNITNIIMCLADGWAILDEIDGIIQKEFIK